MQNDENGLCYPNYYPRFKCIADKCSDTCCRGWDICIDENSLEKYRSIGGNIGKRLSECITTDSDGAHFILVEDERCPFLNSSNLCDLYIALGEDSLCGICTDHPRFRSFLSDRTEIGVGLCCEAAAEIILTGKNPIHIVPEADFPDDALEKAVLQIRKMLFRLCERDKPFIALRKCCAPRPLTAKRILSARHVSKCFMVGPPFVFQLDAVDPSRRHQPFAGKRFYSQFLPIQCYYPLSQIQTDGLGREIQHPAAAISDDEAAANLQFRQKIKLPGRLGQQGAGIKALAGTPGARLSVFHGCPLSASCSPKYSRGVGRL